MEELFGASCQTYSFINQSRSNQVVGNLVFLVILYASFTSVSVTDLTIDD